MENFYSQRLTARNKFTIPSLLIDNLNSKEQFILSSYYEQNLAYVRDEKLACESQQTEE